MSQEGDEGTTPVNHAVSIVVLAGAIGGAVGYLFTGHLVDSFASELEAVWLTFFIVWVIVLDRRRSLRRQLRRSGSLFRETWGESVSAAVGVNFVFLIVALPGVALGTAGYVVLDGVLAVVAMVGGCGIVVAAIVGSQTASAIVRTVLYRYATTGKRVDSFDARDPNTVFPER